MTKKNSTELWKIGAEFLHAEHSIMCGAMSWVSEHSLVSAISNAGGFGVIACGSMGPELLDKEIKLTRTKTSKSFGVNLSIYGSNRHIRSPHRCLGFLGHI